MARNNKSDGEERREPAIEAEVKEAVAEYRCTNPIASPAAIEHCLHAWKRMQGLDDADWDRLALLQPDDVKVLDALFGDKTL